MKKHPFHSLFSVLGTILLLIGNSSIVFSSGIPTSGIEVPDLADFDTAIDTYMTDRNIPSGSICVMKDGVVVLERGYGYRDQGLTILTEPDTIYRIASAVKPITAAAIRHLISQGQLQSSDIVFDVGQPGGGILQVTPFNTPDARLKDITIENLLDHKGGWDRSATGDPMFMSVNIANDLGVPSPPSRTDIVRYVAGQALTHEPGTTYAYSNFGYMVLGLILEQVSGMSYTEYAKQFIYHPTEVPSIELQAGRTLPQFRDPREPYYEDPFIGGPNVFNPTQTIRWPDGAWHLEAFVGVGNLVTTTRAYVEFLERFWMSGDPRMGENYNYWFTGSVDGTYTMVLQLPNRVNIAAFFNQRATNPQGPDYFLLKGILEATVAGISTWPTNPPQGQNQPDGTIGEKPSRQKGNGNYGPSAGQKVKVKTKKRRVVLSLTAQIDGITHDSNRMSARKTNRKTKVKYTGPTGNATAALLAGRYETPLAPAGTVHRFKAKISKSSRYRKRRAKASSSINLVSKKEPTARDQIAYNVTLK